MDQKVTQCVEALCEAGCDAVRATIKAMEAGHPLAQTSELSDDQINQVLEELKTIMAVYDRD